MNPWSLFLLSLGSLLWTSHLFGAGADDPEAVGAWHYDLRSGFAEAQKTGKPLLVVFR